MTDNIEDEQNGDSKAAPPRPLPASNDSAENDAACSAVAFCTAKIRHFEKKAAHNKHEALCCFCLVLICSLTAPLFVTLSDGYWFGKVLPSVLSITAAGATAWIQLRRPQQLWHLYRTIQRELEDQHSRFIYKIGEYLLSINVDALLAERTADIVMRAHRAWLPLVPGPEDLAVLNPSDTIPPTNRSKIAARR